MNLLVSDPDFSLYVGDVREVLATLPDESVHCVVTSPPYWGLRNYAVEGQLGLEPTPEEYVANMVAVFREVRRVLRKDGTCWVNLGDTYNSRLDGSHGGWNGSSPEPQRTKNDGADQKPKYAGKPKDLVGIPWRIAFALQADGWYLRSDIIWSKPNPMPESVTDRPTKAHEYVFLLTKSPRYFFDQEAVRETAVEGTDLGLLRGRSHDATGMVSWAAPSIAKRQAEGIDSRNGNPTGRRNIRSVWEIATQPYPEAHFACVDDQTEALTPTGWKRHEDLGDGDLIAMYDPETDRCRFSPATFHRYDFGGELVAIEKRDSSQRLTPNHRCFVRRRGSDYAMVVRADELRPSMDILTCAPFDVDELEGIGRNHAALLGWYTAEGSDNHPGYVTIYQSESANPAKVAEIRSLLQHVGADYHEGRRERHDSGVDVAFGVRGKVGSWLQSCGKILDAAAIRLPVGEGERLLSALVDGDGHRRRDGRSCIIQKDKTSIDRMQMLALRLGYRAIISERQGGGYVLYLTEGRWLTLRGTDGKHQPLGREPYTGTVWCPTVATGLWLARRRGRPFVTGNTYPEALVERCIKAGTSERGCCPECGAPWVRETKTMYQPVKYPGGVETPVGEPVEAHKHESHAKEIGGPQSWEYGRARKIEETTGWLPSCRCYAREREFDRDSDSQDAPWMAVPCVVLDPFLGSGTTALVARKHGRRCVGIELSPEYAALAAKRLSQLSLLA